MKSKPIEIVLKPVKTTAILFNGSNDAECLEFCPKAVDPDTDRPLLIVNGEECRPGMYIVLAPLSDTYFVCTEDYFNKYYSVISE